MLVTSLPITYLIEGIAIHEPISEDNHLEAQMDGKMLPKSWTVMVYLDADNNLDSYGVTDVNEMEMVGSSSEVNFIVLLDRESSGGEVYYIQQDSI